MLEYSLGRVFSFSKSFIDIAKVVKHPMDLEVHLLRRLDSRYIIGSWSKVELNFRYGFHNVIQCKYNFSATASNRGYCEIRDCFVRAVLIAPNRAELPL